MPKLWTWWIFGISPSYQSHDGLKIVKCWNSCYFVIRRVCFRPKTAHFHTVSLVIMPIFADLERVYEMSAFMFRCLDLHIL